MKKCKKCGVKKPLSEFYKHALMVDGHLNICKDCKKAYIRKYSKTPKGKAVDRKREKTVKRKVWKKQYQRKYRERNRLKYKARTIVTNALRDGKLKREPCEVCGKKAESHHDDYNKPLEVRWLCFKHHRELHGQHPF